MRKTLFIFILLLAFIFIGCSNKPASQGNEPDDEITYYINAKDENITLDVGDVKEITFDTNLEDDISIKLKNDGILELTGKTIKALKSGSTTVELYFIYGNDRISDTINVIVNREPIRYSFSFKQEELLLDVDGEYNIEYDTDYDGEIEFSSSDENVAKVLSGVIYTFNTGVTTITAKLNNELDQKFDIKLTVKEKDTMYIVTINNSGYEVKEGTSFIDFLEEKYGENLAPSKYNYKFDAYYLDSECTQKLDLYSFVTCDIQLYPKYNIIEYSFDVDNVYRIVGGKNISGNVIIFTRSYAYYDLTEIDLSEYYTFQVKYDLILLDYKISMTDTKEIPYDGFLLAIKKDSGVYRTGKGLLKTGKKVYLDNYSVCFAKRITLNKQNPIEQVDEISAINGITASFVSVYDATNKKTLFRKNGELTAYPASTTKIVTALTALKYCDFDDSYTCGDELDCMWQGSSPGTAGMVKGQVWTIRNLLYAALLPSGNDAAYGLAACTIAKLYPNNTWTARQRIDKFAELMNQTIEEIGCVHSHFMTPDGNSYYTSSGAWEERLSKHFVCADDMCRIANYAFRVPELVEIVRTTSISIYVGSKNYSFTNTNKLLRGDSGYYYAGTVGMKTGTTTPGGNCLVSGVWKKDRLIIVAMLKSTTSNGRYDDSLKVYNAVFPA